MKKQKRTRVQQEDYDAYQSELASFKRWWEPFSTDPLTGASIGGQPDAWRWWARPVPGDHKRWERKQYGEWAKRAFKAKSYYEWFKQWLEAGGAHGQWVQFLGEGDDGQLLYQIHDEPFVSNCLPVEEQSARMGEIYAMIGNKQHIA